jgi:hypothetical protein
MEWEIGIRARLRVARAILRPLWVRICVPVTAVIGFYDAGVTQLVPREQAEKFPKVYQLISVTSGFLPWWGWILVLAALFVGATIEYEARQHRGKGAALEGPPEPSPVSVAPQSGRKVFLRDGARALYEAIERSGIDPVGVTAGGYSSPDVPLDYCVQVIVSAARKGDIQLYGTRPPSRQSLPIPPEALADLRFRSPDSLMSLMRSRPTDFHDVWLSRRDLKRVIDDHIASSKRLDAAFS